MERKSIGQFIAALRKSRGYTQAQLAEKLNVSDKAISRWERDESAPDLALIPVIAEIFEVTSDEILRGEKLGAEEPRSSERPKKQMERLLSDAKTKFQVRSILSLGIGVIGLLAAMLCNYGLLRARIGFIVGCIFYVAAIGLESVFLVLGFSAVSHEDFEGQKLRSCKRYMIRLTGATVTVIVAMFAVSLPLITLAWDAYVGITAQTWLTSSIPYLLISLLVCGFAYFLADRFLLNKGVYVLSEKESAQRKVRRHCAMILVLIIAITFVGQFLFNVIVMPADLAHAEVFYTPEDFIAYMEKPVGSESYVDNGEIWIIEGLLGSDMEEEKSEISFYDSNGEEKIYAYTMRNHAVSSFTQEVTKDGATRCYKVYTAKTLQQGYGTLLLINRCWLLLYTLETVIVIGVYFVKRRRADKK